MKNTYPIIGMSPGNSYFKDDIVIRLLKKVVEKYGKTAVIIPDIPAISTYIALGYPKNRARRDKALPHGNNLKNKVLRAMSELGYSADQVRIINWESEIENNTDYQEKYHEVLNLYVSSMHFKDSADDATRGVLEYSDKEISDLDKAVKIAVHYLLSEIAFMELAPKLLKVKKVVYVYHRNWPVYEKYIAGEFDNKPKHCLGFEIVKIT